MEAHSFTAIGAISINKLWQLTTKNASINDLSLSYILSFFIFSTVEHIGSIDGGAMRPKTSINYAKY
jgi:hypothetical protein